MPNNLPSTILTIDQILVGDGSENNDDDEDGGEEVDNDGMVMTESQKPRQRVSNADRKVFANPESFCDKFIIG